MSYKIVNIRTSAHKDPDDSILIIYTGGTFGMVLDEEGSLAPFNFSRVIDQIPELKYLELRLTVISFPSPIDSSNVRPHDWKNIASIIYENYDLYDGFVILHGTDTMAYTASALSYMLQGLDKPVILTGAQIPIGSIRSDARENLITALEIASSKREGIPIINEVCIYFNFYLLRGNRSQKVKSSTFAAFESQNYPVLAESGIEIEFNYSYLRSHPNNSELTLKTEFEDDVAIMKIFPGIPERIVDIILFEAKPKGLILETYGSGNTMNDNWFVSKLEEAIRSGMIIYNVSQCSGGEVIQGRYETSKRLKEIGVISGGDITADAAVTKLMFLLANEPSNESLKKRLSIPIAGEMD